MYYIETEKNVKIAVDDLNPQGCETLVFIHGWPLNSKMFEYQLNVLLKCNYRCILIDLRGFGQSDHPADGYCYDRMAEDVYKVLCNTDANNVTLVGYSMGGAIAIRYMVHCKGYKVKKLVLLSAAAPSATQRPGFPYGVPAETYDAMIQGACKDRPQVVVDFGLNAFASNPSDAFRQWFNDLGFSANGLASIKMLKALRDEDLREDLCKVCVPTGIFHGALDKIVPYDLALQMHKCIKGSLLYRFEKSGHAIFYDELKTFNNSLISFLQM